MPYLAQSTLAAAAKNFAAISCILSMARALFDSPPSLATPSSRSTKDARRLTARITTRGDDAGATLSLVDVSERRW